MTAPGLAPRHVALSALLRVRNGRPLHFEDQPDFRTLSTADRHLAHELTFGVLRQRSVLDRVIRPVLSRPEDALPVPIEEILRIGAYQIGFLDRVPAYAAVTSAVSLAKDCDSRLAPMVNAVLRRIARDGYDPASIAKTLPLVERYSHPAWIVDRWVNEYGAARTEALLAFNNTKPPVSLRPIRWTTDKLVEAFDQAGVTHGRSGETITIEGGQITDLPGYREGAFIVQDSGQSRLLAFAEFPTDATVWDACAAPGGKTVALATKHPVVAAELSRRRMKRLRTNLDRVGAAGLPTPLVCADATLPPLAPNSMQAVLADVPCTATGTFRRHPEARWLLTSEHIRRATLVQTAILDGLAPTLSRGGVLVYLTCSMEPEENQHAVDAFLDRHPEFARSCDDLVLLPPDTDTDGGYGARLERAG